MKDVLIRLGWAFRRLAWKVDERIFWPTADATERVQVLADEEPETRAIEHEPWWRRYGPDLLLAVVLGVVAVLSRRHGLPTDGLWQDDAEPGSAAMKAPLDQLILVGKDHPGYIAILKGWRELVAGGSDSLAGPAFIAGFLGPPLLYLGLRALRFARSISFLLAAALVAAQPHIINSGRLRTFTIDLLVVLGLAVVVPRLARIRWTWITAVVWLIGAFLVASISGFALGAVLAAGAILVLHRRSDFVVRAIAFGAQIAATGALYADEARNYSSEKIETAYRELWDAFPDFHANPISFAGELLLHLRRLAEAFPGGPAWFAMICGLVAVAGLVIASFPGRRTIAARFLLLVLIATIIGSLFGKVPFGPSQTSATNNGYRVSVWLFPVIAVGLGVALQAGRGLLGNRRALRNGFDVAAFAAAAVLLVSAGPAVRYPFPGAKSATQYIEANAGPRDSIILPFHTEWSFAAESKFPVKMVAAPTFTESFDPVGWSDPRIHYIDLNMDRAQVAAAIQGADRVFVYYPALETGGLVPPETQTRSQLTSMLQSLGLTVQNRVSYQDGNAAVDVLGHGPAPAGLGQVNLQASDLPQGWSLAEPTSTPGRDVLNCIKVVPAGPPDDSVVSATAPGGLNLISELERWPGPAGPRRAAAAFAGPNGAACVSSTLQASLAAIEVPVVVEARRAGKSSAGSITYRVTMRAHPGGPPVAEGSVVFQRRGAISALTVVFRARQQPFPPRLLASLVGTVERRIAAAG